MLTQEIFKCWYYRGKRWVIGSRLSDAAISFGATVVGQNGVTIFLADDDAYDGAMPIFGGVPSWCDETLTGSCSGRPDVVTIRPGQPGDGGHYGVRAERRGPGRDWDRND